MQLQSRYRLSTTELGLAPTGNDVRFRKLDLNLLVALDSLLNEANVTRAAKHMHITQSAMSAALGRLRDHFGDPLLVPSGRGMQRTRLAEDLMLPLADLVGRIDMLVSTGRRFDAKTATDRFVIMFASTHVPDVGAAIVDEVLKQAPNVQVELRLSSQTASAALEDLDVDLVWSPEQIQANDQPQLNVGAMPHVAVCATNSALGADGKPVGFAAFCSARHIAYGGSASPLVGGLGETAEAAGTALQIDANTTGISVIVQLLKNPLRVALLPSNVAKIVLANGGSRALPLGFAVEDHVSVLQWRERDQLDPAVTWLRGIVAACVLAESQT